MATIGSLHVKLTMASGQFLKAADTAAKTANKLGSAIGAMAVSAGAMAAKVAVDLADMAERFIQWGADSAVALGKTAREIGATTEGLASLQHAAALLGGSSDDVTGALTALSTSLSAAMTGSVGLNDVFRRLGLDAKQLAKLPVDQAFLKIAASIGAISDPTQRAAAASQIFGDQAAKILPLLSQGQAGLAKFADEARAMGLALDAQQASAAEDAFVISNLMEAIKGLAMQIAVQLAPWINALVIKLGEFAKGGGAAADTAKTVATAFQFVAKVIAGIIDTTRLFEVGFKLMGNGFVQMAQWAVKAIQKVLDAASYLPEALGGGAAARGAEKMKQWSDDLVAMIQAGNDGIKATLDRPWATDKVDAFFKSVNDQMRAFDTKRLSDKTGGGSMQIAARNAAAFKEGIAVIDQAKTPMEAFGSTLLKINNLLQAGAIGCDTYAKSAANAVAQLEKAHNLQDIRMAGAVRAGTSEAYSAVIQSQKESDVRFRESPQQRIERVMRESAAVEKQQLEVQRRIARALEQDPAVRAILP